MNFFNLCCHSKSKKSLEYINDWIDAHLLAFNSLSTAVTSLQTWKDTIENDIIDIVKEVADTYDYASALPQLTTMSNDITDLQSNLSSLDTIVSNKLSNFTSTLNTLQNSLTDKVNKIIPTAINNIALLDSTGNLIDSGINIKDIKSSSITNNTYGLQITETGEIWCELSSIILKGDFDYDDWGQVEITPEHVPNIRRSLLNPDSVPILDSDKLITSGAVFKALESPKETVLKFIEYNGDPVNLEGIFSGTGFSSSSIKICLKSTYSLNLEILSIFYSDENFPIHTNSSNGDTIIFPEGYGIFTIYRINQAETEHTDDYHSESVCYFITVEGMFESSNSNM